MNHTDQPRAVRVYSMDDQGLTAEQIAVTFAMTSRNPDPFDVIAGRVSEQKAAEFNDRWVIGYGHASVAEHAVLHLALENISRLAADRVLDNRLASYTEKSSRYQVIAPNDFHIPSELEHTAELRQTFRQACAALFSAYQSLNEAIIAYLQANTDRQSDETDYAYRLRLRRQATDASRSVLPAASLTNLGMTANARTLEHAITKLLSSELAEAHQVGEMMLQTSQTLAPTLVKYAGRNPILARRHREVYPRPSATPPDALPPSAQVLDYPADPIRDLAAAILLRGGSGYEQAQADAGRMSANERTNLIDDFIGNAGPHDTVPREFELPRYRIRFRLDYGAFREFRRHRMLTLLVPPLTIANGYATDPLITAAGPSVAETFHQAVANAESTYRLLDAHHPPAARYLITHAHYQTAVANLNLREAYHLFGLRSGPAAHRGIREPVIAAMQAVEAVNPGILRWMPGHKENPESSRCPGPNGG